MKFMATWTGQPSTVRETVNRFLAGRGQPPEGVTLLGRWHKADGSGGFTLFETNNPAALFKWVGAWSDVLEIHAVPVIEDADAGSILAKAFKKQA